jgi:hypothetical protein
MSKTGVSGCVAALAELDKALKDERKIPDDCFTAEDIANERGVKLSRAREIGREMVRLGIATADVWAAGGSRRVVFRLVGGKKRASS